jgi:hypothetical protein
LKNSGANTFCQSSASTTLAEYAFGAFFRIPESIFQ